MTTQQTAKTQYVVAASGTKYGYRRLGTGPGTPMVMLIHFRGTQDKWDPLLINTLAASRPIITVDYAGVGHSTGEVATTVRRSAADIEEFVEAIGETEIDLLGFSLGGYVAQVVALNADPAKFKVRKLILAGTGTSTGDGISQTTNDIFTYAGGPHVTIEGFQTLFFPKTHAGAFASEQWWARIHERSTATTGEEVTTWVSDGYVDAGKGLQNQQAQGRAFADPETSKGLDGAYDRLKDLQIPVLVAQGHDDYMIPTSNSFTMQQKLPNGQLIIYPDSGHGFLFQYATLFVKHVLLFLEA